jgi:hypothetical protein
MNIDELKVNVVDVPNSEQHDTQLNANLPNIDEIASVVSNSAPVTPSREKKHSPKVLVGSPPHRKLKMYPLNKCGPNEYESPDVEQVDIFSE